MKSSGPTDLSGCRILVGLTGSIAIYKSVYLLRLLKQSGADVQVIMSAGAREFVQPLTFSAISERPVLSEFHNPQDGHWNNHVSLGLEADLFVIAPLSAHTLSKMAYGHADNLLITTYLSARCPLLLAPAMDLDMYAHPSTQNNLSILRERGHHILDAENGPLASGLSGQGRMSEPETIYQHICSLLKKPFKHLPSHDTPEHIGGQPHNTSEHLNKQPHDAASEQYEKRVLITAGPTYEPLDPVRFIGNRSSGKMGIAIAEVFAAAGHQVDLILGPTHLSTQPSTRIKTHRIQTAEEMNQLAAQLHPQCHIAVFAAAVADYKPEQSHTQKIKKHASKDMKLTLVKNPDIAYNLGKHKKKGQLHIGFALETQNETQNAAEKLQKKRFDLLICNSLQEEGAGFYHDTNKVTFFYKDGRTSALPLKSKQAIAFDILDATQKLLQA